MRNTNISSDSLSATSEIITIPDGNGRILIPKRYSANHRYTKRRTLYRRRQQHRNMGERKVLKNPLWNPEEFSEALQEILGEENLGEEEAETSDKSVE